MRSAASRRLVTIVFLALSDPLVGEEPAPAAQVRLLVQRSPVAGFHYYAGAEIWDALREGDSVQLVAEPGNLHDARAIRIEWRGRMLGYLPRRENDAVAWALHRGDRLHARIHRLRAHPNPARRVEIDVYVE